MGAQIGGLVWDSLYLLFGIYFIYVSKKKNEKFGNKAALVRMVGIILAIVGAIKIVLGIL